MEQGHGAVGDVIGTVAIGLGRDHADGCESPLGTTDGFRFPGRARGEQEQIEVTGLRPGHPDQGRRILTVDHLFLVRSKAQLVHPHGGAGRGSEVESIEQGGPHAVGDDRAAAGPADVTGQGLAPPGRVDAHDHRTGQRGTAQPEEVIRQIAHQDADVQGAARRASMNPPPRRALAWTN